MKILIEESVLRQALEALENYTAIKHPQQRSYRDAAIAALRSALAEPQEPDYWREEARRYAGNADYWRKRYEALPEQGPVDVNVRPCTCHPDDNPPTPCARQYALHECKDYDEDLHKAWVDAAMVKAYDFAEAHCNHQCDGEMDRIHELNATRRALREHLIGQPASMTRESELVARMEEKHGMFMAQARAEIKMLYGAIEGMRSDPATHYCHRFAILMECMLMSNDVDLDRYWDEAHALLDEYNSARDKWMEAHGQPYVSGFGKD